MTPADVLTETYGRIAETGLAAVQGLEEEQLLHRPGPDANPIGWLVWHLSRVQDDHVADVAGTEQVWTSEGYAGRFDLPYETGSIGYGHTSAQVAAFSGGAELIGDYLRAVHRRSSEYLGTVAPADLDRIVDERWDPPVTLAARLVSVASDGLQHAGQAAYVRGLLG